MAAFSDDVYGRRITNTSPPVRAAISHSYKDTVINGKFLAAVVMITIMMVSIVMVITGLGQITLGYRIPCLCDKKFGHNNTHIAAHRL